MHVLFMPCCILREIEYIYAWGMGTMKTYPLTQQLRPEIILELITVAISVNSLVQYFRQVKMSVYVANIFATLLNHATKFKEVKIREKVSPVLVSNGRRE